MLINDGVSDLFYTFSLKMTNEEVKEAQTWLELLGT
jgi:hypothetical protein